MILVKIIGIAGAALLLICSLMQLDSFLYGSAYTTLNYYEYVLGMIADLLIIVFCCALKKEHIKHLLKEEHY